MKLGLFDHAGGKTTKEIVKWFEKRGDEVRWTIYADYKVIDWADVTIFEWIDNNLKAFTTETDPEVWIECRNKKPRIVTRAMDIEIYAGHFRAVDYNFVEKLVYSADHIWEAMQNGPEWDKFPHLKPERLPLSVDMSEFKYAKREPGVNIAFMGDMWWAKAPEMIFQVIHMLNKKTGKRYHLHMRVDLPLGVWEWFNLYMKNIIKVLDIDVTVYRERVDDLNAWMDNMNYLVTTNMKDAFSLIVGEAMAKGIKAFPHHFYGAPGIWGKYVWSSIDELVDRIVGEEYNSEEYYQFMKENYSNEVVMPKWEKILLR